MGNLSFARSRATMVTFVLAAMLVGVAHASDTEVNKAAEAPAPASAPSATPAETPAVRAPVAVEPSLKVPAGWRKQTRNGDVAYCRKIVTLGSRFEKLQCMSEAELEQYITMNEENRDTMQQRISICGTSSVCSNP